MIFESKGNRLSSSAECRIQTQDVLDQISSRLNARWQTDQAIEGQAKSLNSIDRPYDQRGFSPSSGDIHACCCLFWCSGTCKRFSNWKETSFCFILRNAGFEPKISRAESPANWMLADKLTELSRIKLQTWTQCPKPMISECSAHSTPLPAGFHTWLWRYTCLFLLILMLWRRQAIYEVKGDKLSPPVECRIRTHGLRNRIFGRLNACW